MPADVVAAVLVLQALEGRSDREAVEALTFDLRWKAACGLPVAAVLVLQALEGRSDREAVEALTFDLRWKAACGCRSPRPGSIRRC